MSPEKMSSSAEKSNVQEAVIEAGDMLWNVLQELGANPTLQQTEVTWKREDSEETLLLNSDEWRSLPVGAKVRVEDGKISVENPGYSPKSVKKGEVIKKAPISEEQYKEEQEEHDVADGLLEYELMKEEEQEKAKLEIPKVLDAQEKMMLNNDFPSGHIEIMKSYYLSEDYLKILGGENLLKKLKIENLDDFNAEIDKETDLLDDMPSLSLEELEVRLKKVTKNVTAIIERYEEQYLVSLREEERGVENNDLLDNDFEKKERKKQDKKLLDEINKIERERNFEQSQKSLKEEGFSEKHLAIWKEFYFSEEINEISVGLTERSIKLVKNKKFHEEIQEFMIGLFNSNPLEEAKNMSPQEFQVFLKNIIDQVRRFIEKQEAAYNQREANKTNQDREREALKQRTAHMFVDELLPIPKEKEMLWNKHFEEGDTLSLAIDFREYRLGKISPYSLSRKAKEVNEHLEELRGESREEALTLNYFLGESVRQRSPILYKIYLTTGNFI